MPAFNVTITGRPGAYRVKVSGTVPPTLVAALSKARLMHTNGKNNCRAVRDLARELRAHGQDQAATVADRVCQH